MIGSLFGMDDVDPVYANDVQTAHNPIEMKLRFRFISDARGKTVADVVMHPTIAKALVDHLKQAVEAYEKEHGTIYLPTDVSGLEGLFKSKVKEDEDGV